MRWKEELSKMDDESSEIREEISRARYEAARLMREGWARYFCQTNKLPKNKVPFRTPVYLDYEVDKFIEWYTANMVKENYTDIGESRLPIEMRNLIEKMAVWYELRYPDYEINRIMPYSSRQATQVSDEMFNKNDYINHQFDSDSEVRILDWAEFYNRKAFIHSLPSNEKLYFVGPQYPEIVFWDLSDSMAHLHLSKKGTVEMSEYMDTVIPGISNKDFEGKNIKEVVEMIETKGIKIPGNNEFVKAIQNYDNWTYQKEEMLNCVMYRIIERGGIRIGPRRAFLFAKEFGRNIDIPMIYGVDYSDPGLRLFMNEYIKSGGSKDLICYDNYFSSGRNGTLTTVTMSELIKTQWHDTVNQYTPEEEALHQRLVDALASQVNQEEVSKEEAGLERKLSKKIQTKKR